MSEDAHAMERLIRSLLEDPAVSRGFLQRKRELLARVDVLERTPSKSRAASPPRPASPSVIANNPELMRDLRARIDVSRRTKR